MYKNESGYTATADDIIRKFGMSIPFIVVAYGLLAQYGYISSINFKGPLWFGLIVVGWLILGIIQFSAPSKSATMSIIRLSADHILAALSCIFISESVLILWPILMMATYIYFGKIGMRYNIIAYIIITCLDIALNLNNPSYIITASMTALTITITGIAVIIVSRSHEINQEKIYRSRLNESMQRDRTAAIVNNLTDAIISTDRKGIIRVYNAASLDLLDTNISLNGHNVENILRIEDLDGNPVNVLSELNNVKTVRTRDDVCLLLKHDEKVRLSATYTPIRRGYSNTRKSELHDGYIIILRDITKEKSLEIERDEFISVASHELRTPITIAEGTLSNLELMLKRPDMTLIMIKSAVQLAHDQIVFLANMVNDLSTLSRAEKSKSDEAEDIDVINIAHNLISRYSEEAQKAGLALDLDTSPSLSHVHVSRLYLEELLQNFMTNAIKYTKEGKVTLIIKQGRNKILFAVKDTGIGISKSDQQKIFSKFYRSDDFRTREKSGTGLGLYVSAKLAKKLGTKIEIESRLNFGSTFSFTLPIASTVNAQNGETNKTS